MKTKKITVISLILGICTFATAAFANSRTSNGYDVFKNSIKNIIGLENYTLNTQIVFNSDDDEFFKVTAAEEYNGESQTYYSNETESYPIEYSENNYSYTVYSTPDVHYTVTNGDVSKYDGIFFTGTLSRFDKSDKTTNNIIRFGELFADTMVGDLKNNFTLIDSNDESSTYEIKLSSIQIPEIVNAGFSIIFSQLEEDNPAYYSYSESDFEHKLSEVGAEPTVTDASLIFTVDNKGFLTNCTAQGTLSGNGHKLSTVMDFSLSDIGTTVPKTISEEDMIKANNTNIDTEYTEYTEYTEIIY